MTQTPAGAENRAKFFLPRCKQLRMNKGKSMNDLAKEAEVDRASVKKIESKHAVTELMASKVFNALNQWHSQTLERAKEITVIRPN